MPDVEIPELGTVEFPDSMSHEDILAAAADLYSNNAAYNTGVKPSALLSKQAQDLLPDSIRERMDSGSPEPLQKDIVSSAVESAEPALQQNRQEALAAEAEGWRSVANTAEWADMWIRPFAGTAENPLGAFGSAAKPVGSVLKDLGDEAVNIYESVAASKGLSTGAIDRDVVRMLPTVASAMGGSALLQAAGMAPAVAAPLAFGAVPFAETLSETGNTPAAVMSGVTGSLIPGVGEAGREAVASILGKAITSGAGTAGGNLTQKIAESIGTQGAIQVFMEGLNLPEYMAMSPEERKKTLIHNVAVNSAFLAMDVPGLMSRSPSATAQHVGPHGMATAKVGEVMERLVNDPAAVESLRVAADDFALRATDPGTAKSPEEILVAKTAEAGATETAKATAEAADAFTPEPKKGGDINEIQGQKEKGLQVAPDVAPTAETAAGERSKVEPEIAAPATPASEPSVSDKLNKVLNETTPEEGMKYKSPTLGRSGWTPMMWDIGAQAKTPEDVAALKDAAEKHSAKVKALMDSAKEPGISMDDALDRMSKASMEAGKQIAEAYEFATGVRLNGDPKWKMFEDAVPGYKPSVPDPKYVEAHPEVKPVEETVASESPKKGSVKNYTVTLNFEHPAYDEKGGIKFEVTGKSKSDAIKAARREASNAGHLAGGKGRVSFKAEEAERVEPAPESPQESRINSEREPDIFKMDDEGLDAFFESQFGSTGATGVEGEMGRRGMFSFPDYDAFKKWMEERYAARDIDSMRLAFAEAPTSQKKRYLKDARTESDHKKAWVAHLATGAVLPADDPPISNPNPAPPGSGTSTAPPPGQPPTGNPPQPPANPRSPTRRVKFDTMALTQLLRMFDKFPVVNRRLVKAYGRYMPGTGEVQMKSRLMWDKQLAERVLAHESGHFVDLFLSPAGRGLPFAERLSPLRNFRNYIAEKKAWRAEAVALSRAWRGPFSLSDPYRNSASELFADFMSAMFNKPEWVNQNFPVLHDAFAELLAGKGDFRAAYEEMTRWLEGGTIIGEWRSQKRGAVERTISDLTKESVKTKRSAASVLGNMFMSTWYDAYGIERPSDHIGSRLSDDIELSSMWAAKESALFADDIGKEVQPHLNRVDPDPVEAHSYLQQYAEARRTIMERRAAGKWIENNPGDARVLLDRIVAMDPLLTAKFQAELQAAPASRLYDLSAEIFREIHDRDLKTKGGAFVNRIRRAIDRLQLGVTGEAALEAFNVRGKLENPGGLDIPAAEKVLAELRTELGPQRMQSLEDAATNLRKLLSDVQEKAYNEGLISKKNWDELIEPNKDNYLPYAVLDWWEGRVSGGLRKQAGTAKDIADVLFATEMKVASLNSWRQRQRQVQLLMDIYAKGNKQVTVGERLKDPRDIKKIRDEHPDDDISRAVIWQDGSPHVVEFPDNPGKTFEKSMDQRAFYSHMEPLARAGKIGHSIMQLYTTLSLPFMIYRNPGRGAKTAALRLGFANIGKNLGPEGYGILKALASTIDPSTQSPKDELGKAAKLAINYARAAFGEPMLPEIRDMIDKQIILPPRFSSAMVRDADNLQQLLENGGILAFQVAKAKEDGWPFWKRFAPTRESMKFAEEVFTAYEAFEKIYNFEAAKAKGYSEEKSIGIARRSGIPNPGVGGHFTMPMEVFFPWTRVKIQGLRSTINTLSDPEMGQGFQTRFMLTEALPRIAKVAIGAGVASGAIKWMMHKDEDENDPVMGEVFRRMSPYKMALDEVVPIMFFDPRSGKYHYLNEFKRGKDVPLHYEVVSFRIPSSEEGRTFGPLIYNLLASTQEDPEKVMGGPGVNPVSAVAGWVKQEMAPNPSPAIEFGKNMYKLLSGENPDDPFRKQPVANKTLYDAGFGEGRGQAILGYALNQAGFAGDMASFMAMTFGLLDDRAISAVKKRVAGDKSPLEERMPLIKNMLSYDNYSQYRQEKISELEQQKLQARAKLSLSPEVRAIYDYYNRNLGDFKKLDTLGRQRFIIAQDFHTRWGTREDKWSLYSRAIQASDDKSSKMARESAKRDLDLLSSPFVARWNFVNEMNRQ